MEQKLKLVIDLANSPANKKNLDIFKLFFKDKNNIIKIYFCLD